MKNSSKNNSEKDSNQNKKNTNSNFYSKKTNSSNKNNNFLTNSSKNKSFSNLKKSEKYKNYSSLKKGNLMNKSNTVFSKKCPDNYSDPTYKKSFDDWIWGKHSVFEALTTKRAINRIWCTSEIYSSEKFFILLKDLKSKGVLIEEVSWNRISQLTFGATHQGVALQLACSKTVPLDDLIDQSKKKLHKSNSSCSRRYY